jgi:hypothetical protein
VMEGRGREALFFVLTSLKSYDNIFLWNRKTGESIMSKKLILAAVAGIVIFSVAVNHSPPARAGSVIEEIAHSQYVKNSEEYEQAQGPNSISTCKLNGLPEAACKQAVLSLPIEMYRNMEAQDGAGAPTCSVIAQYSHKEFVAVVYSADANHLILGIKKSLFGDENLDSVADELKERCAAQPDEFLFRVVAHLYSDFLRAYN